MPRKQTNADSNLMEWRLPSGKTLGGSTLKEVRRTALFLASLLKKDAVDVTNEMGDTAEADAMRHVAAAVALFEGLPRAKRIKAYKLMVETARHLIERERGLEQLH